MKNAIKSMIMGSSPSGSLTNETTYLLFRFYAGFSMAIGAGWSKVFHKIDENGGEGWDNLAFGVPSWFVEQVGGLGFTFLSPSFWAHLAVYGEFLGGIFIALGFLTRLSALQLAFQFFIVSFVWYDKPELFAMYYQQLIFWGFVLIAAVGGGRFSVDAWLAGRSRGRVEASAKLAVAAFLLLLPCCGFSQQQAPPARVSFTVSNPGLKARELDIRYFDQSGKKAAGYGYGLNGLSSHAVNMPVGTRVYEKTRDSFALVFVVTADDNGRRFSLGKRYEISPTQRQQASADDHAQAAAAEKAAPNPTWEETAKAKGYPMVTFRVAGSSLWPTQVYVRVQLPFENQKSSIGFSRTLSRGSIYEVSYPVGAKVYRCQGRYWEAEVPETLLFTVSADKQGYLLRI